MGSGSSKSTAPSQPSVHEASGGDTDKNITPSKTEPHCDPKQNHPDKKSQPTSTDNIHGDQKHGPPQESNNSIVFVDNSNQSNNSKKVPSDKSQSESTVVSSETKPGNVETTVGMKTETPSGVGRSTENHKEAPKKDPLQEAQEKFDLALRLACDLSRPEDILDVATKDVRRLTLSRCPPSALKLFKLMAKLPHLQIVDISGNQLGPPSFRATMYAMGQNSTITDLNVADNLTDTDSAESIQYMLSRNKTLTCLNVSGNYLGKDYFSRCVGPALAENSTLQILRCESIGSTDMKILSDNLVKNKSLKELNLSHNEISNSAVLASGISIWLKTDGCPLCTLQLRNCGLKSDDLSVLCTGIMENTNCLEVINISGNQVGSHQNLIDFILVCICAKNISELRADDMKVAKSSSWKPTPESLKPTGPSKLTSLNMSNCSLQDDIFKSLTNHLPSGSLSNLKDLILNNNSSLTLETLKMLQAVMADSDQPRNLEKLSWGAANQADALPDLFSSAVFPSLKYLNLRKGKISAVNVGRLNCIVKKEGVETLVLDGLKLAGSKALQELFANPTFVASGISLANLAALSLGGCQLNNTDLQPLCLALKQGLPLSMIKVSGNRLTDDFVDELVDALKGQAGHPLILIDLSSNKIKDKGAIQLSDLIKDSRYRSNLKSLNVSGNAIGIPGLEVLVSTLGQTGLTTLQVSGQDTSFDEDDMTIVYTKLVATLGLEIGQDNDQIKTSHCSFPRLPVAFSCKLMSLGGCAGELGERLDSMVINTDFQMKKKTHLSFEHILELASALKGYSSSDCLMSGQEWSNIIAAKKDAPSWLQITDHRSRAIYMSHLPASVTVQKLEGVLEMEADCNVDEVYLCKDLISRKNNGFAWILLSDVDSVDRAVQFYQSGQAHVLGTSYIISRINVSVDDGANTEAEAKARKDMEHRLATRKKEDVAHRAFIQESYQVSQARHAYRLAHPAYADGRIW